MARELPIHNGRMTTDLDANGFKIKNLPPGSGFTQVQSDWGQTDATAPDFIKNKPTIPVLPTLATVATSGSYDDLTDKPTIPAPVDISGKADKSEMSVTPGTGANADKTMIQLKSGTSAMVLTLHQDISGKANTSDVDQALAQKADAKAVGDALDGKLGGICVYPVWVNGFVYYVGDVVFHNGQIYRCLQDGTTDEPGGGMFSPWADRTIDELKQDRLSSQQIGNIDAVPGKADKAEPSAAGNLAALNAQGNLTDSGVKPSDFAAPSDLPYRLVEPGEWEFSGLPSGATNITFVWDSSRMAWQLEFTIGGSVYTMEGAGIGGDSALNVTCEDENYTVTATRASLPGHLLDRAGNRVVVTGDTTLTLPAAVPGYCRDFLVRLEISGSTVPTITFAAPTGETIVYETDGDEFPVPDEAGTWSYSFTENCVAHKFAVSLKKVNEVAAPQAQGGA